MKRGTENVTVQRAGTPTRTGDETPGAVVGVLRGCHVLPRASTENADRGIVSIEGFSVIVPWPQPAPWPTDAEVLATDKIIVRGKEHTVEGVPGEWVKRGKMTALIFQTKRYGT